MVRVRASRFASLAADVFVATAPGPDAKPFSSSFLLILGASLFSILAAVLLASIQSRGSETVVRRLRPSSPLSACVNELQAAD